jgi:hypothetical protein
MDKGLAELLADLAPDDDTGGMLGLDRQADAALALAISAAQAHFEARGEAISAGEALARMADHFLEVWAPFVVDGFGHLLRWIRERGSGHGLGRCPISF